MSGIAARWRTGEPPRRDNGKNHSRQHTNCTTPAAEGNSSGDQDIPGPANKWQAKQWIRFKQPSIPRLRSAGFWTSWNISRSIYPRAHLVEGQGCMGFPGRLRRYRNHFYCTKVLGELQSIHSSRSSRGLNKTSSATHPCFVAHFIQFCSFDVDANDEDCDCSCSGGGGSGGGGALLSLLFGGNKNREPCA